MNSFLKNKITIIINSCDSYEDLWVPFFSLFKKYWDPEGFRIILNTETKEFSFDGLSIECIHPEKPDDPYGKRMINVLSKVMTPFVIPLLDDFFTRKDVDWDLIDRIVGWMENDKNIVYFNCDCTPVFCDYEVDRYPGFRRLPGGNEYRLNMQAAVWRTEKYLSYWRPQVSPWEWEEYTNLLAARSRTDKFYCVTDINNGFCDYGHCIGSWAVVQGKWVKDDVVPLFEREGIQVDLSKRGFLAPTKNTENLGIRNTLKRIKPTSDLINRCLGGKDAFRYRLFVERNSVLGISKYAPDHLYIRYALAREKKRFTRMNNIKQKLTSRKNRG